MPDEVTPFIGLPDDVARLGVQRLMACDLRARAHSRLATRWNAVELSISAATAIAASVAAVSYLKAGWLGVALSILVAVLVPLQRSLGAGGRASDHAKAATLFGSLADSYERYLQLDIGPMAWRHNLENLENVRRHLDKLDGEVTGAKSQAPRVRFQDDEKAATESRGNHLVDYLSMENVVLPPREVWTL
jgi:hypothetical protein